MAIKQSDIKVEYLSFRFYDKRSDLSKQPKGRVENPKKKLQDVFSRYIFNIIAKPKSRSSYDLYRMNPNQQSTMEKTLVRLTGMSVPKDKDDFDAIMLDLC